MGHICSSAGPQIFTVCSEADYISSFGRKSSRKLKRNLLIIQIRLFLAYSSWNKAGNRRLKTAHLLHGAVALSVEQDIWADLCSGAL
jgi:hypothetical protein